MTSYEQGLLTHFGYVETRGLHARHPVPSALAARSVLGRRDQLLEPQPTSGSITSLLAAVPPYFKQAVITPDEREATLAFGIRLMPLARQQQVIDYMRSRLHPPAGVSARLAGIPVVAAEANAHSVLLGAAAADPARGDDRGGLVLLAVLRRPSRALVPLLPIALATGWSALIVFLLGIPLNPMSASLGTLVIAISTEFSVLLSERFRQERDHAPRVSSEALQAHLPLDWRGCARLRHHRDRGLRRADGLEHHDAARFRPRDRDRSGRLARAACWSCCRRRSRPPRAARSSGAATRSPLPRRSHGTAAPAPERGVSEEQNGPAGIGAPPSAPDETDPARVHRLDPDRAARTARATRRRPEAAIDTRPYRWAIGAFGFGLVVVISVALFLTHGLGSVGVPAGARIRDFAAPVATSNLVGDANFAKPCELGYFGARAVNTCLLARRGPFVLAFFVTGSDACVKQINTLQRVSRQFSSSAVAFAAVAVSASKSETAKLVHSHHWTIPVAYDRDGSVGSIYGVAICPLVELVARGGIVKDRLIGDRWLRPAALAARIRALAG